MVVHKEWKDDGRRVVYRCNWAVVPDRDKLSVRWELVTCKNCLRIRRRLLRELGV